MAKIRRFAAALLCLSLAATLAGCGQSDHSTLMDDRELTKYEDVFYEAFDATITISAYCESAEQFAGLFAEARSEFIRYHKLYDIYFSYSGINNIKTVNDNAGIAPVEVPEEIIGLIQFAGEMYVLTGGNVNIAFGSVLKIWHDIRDYNNASGMENSFRMRPRSGRRRSIAALTM